jgi:hypothetical protein
MLAESAPAAAARQAMCIRLLCCAQIGVCINSVRENPDAFACQYPCNYSDWRQSVTSPPRGGLTASGSSGASELAA